jgi:hypothetical protein
MKCHLSAVGRNQIDPAMNSKADAALDEVMTRLYVND